VSAIFWAKAADRWGRRPVLFLGTLGTGLGMMVFGFARSYGQAVAGRLLSGLLCGNLGVLKAYLTEVTDKTNRGGGFAILSIAWSVGTVFSPLIGGMLVKPCEQYPGTFTPGTLLGDTFAYWPYALPSVVCCTVNLVTAVFVYFFLAETLHQGRGSGSGSSSAARRSAYAALPVDSTHGKKHGDGDIEMVPDVGTYTDSTYLDTGGSGSGSGSGKTIRPKQGRVSVPLWQRPVVLYAVTSYGVLCFGQVILDESLPLFFKLATAKGGCGFDSHQIGELLSLAGTCLVVCVMCDV